MEKRLSETDKEKRIKIASIIAIILLLLIISLFLLLYKKTYQITFNSNGGSEVASVKVKDGDKLEEPDDPTKEGYIFAGWYYLDELYDFELPVKSDMTLEAEWAVAGNAEVEGIILNVTNLNLAPNGTALLVATLQPEDAKPVKLIWTSSDETIATVDENGNVKALKEGTVTITVTTEDGKYSASCEVKVSKEVASYTVTENANSSSNSNSNNNTPSTPSTPTTPSNPSIPDTPTTPSTIEPSGVSISGAKDIVVGDTGKLTATITPSDANSKTGLKWSSSNSSVVTVDQNGNIKAVGIGSAIITVTTENGKTASVTINVKSNKVDVTNISISGNDTVTVGSIIKLTATVTPSNATNKKVTWKSSNNNIATVDENGNVKGVSAGTVTITATADGKTDTKTITVKEKPISYVLYLTPINQAADQLFEYKASVKKNGVEFNDFESIIINGHTYRFKVDKKVAANHVASHPETAQMKLKDGTTVTITIKYN